MDIQVAIDRVSLEEAVRMAGKLDRSGADIIEIGTSLIKDYGLLGIRKINQSVKKAKILGDIKTIDEGEYEFRKGYEAGCDYLTVMGVSSIDTIRACYKVAQLFQKEIVIDLLECDKSKIKLLTEFPLSIFCLHTSVDSGATKNPSEDVKGFVREFPSLKRVAIAGGITSESVSELGKTNLEIVVVGSAVTKSTDVEKSLMQFRKEMNK